MFINAIEKNACIDAIEKNSMHINASTAFIVLNALMSISLLTSVHRGIITSVGSDNLQKIINFDLCFLNNFISVSHTVACVIINDIYRTRDTFLLLTRLKTIVLILNIKPFEFCSRFGFFFLHRKR